MVRVFGEFYSKLYKCLIPALHPLFIQETFDSFLADIHLPKLSSADIQKQNASITMEELTATGKHLPTENPLAPKGFLIHTIKLGHPDPSPEIPL